MLTRLVALFPYSPEEARLAALVRGGCARTLSLPPLPVRTGKKRPMVDAW